jgi:hypothetical protein
LLGARKPPFAREQKWPIMSTPWPDRPMSDRSLRVAMSGVVHDDDPTIIADMQAEIERLQAALDGPSYRAAVLKELEAENERLRAAFEQAASIAFNGVEEEGYPGSIDRRPETLRNAILALVKKGRGP